MNMESPVEWREPGASLPHTLASKGDRLVAPGNTHMQTEGSYKMSRGTNLPTTDLKFRVRVSLMVWKSNHLCKTVRLSQLTFG